MPMRSLPQGEISDEKIKGLNSVGTIIITPSGSGVGRPRSST